MHGVIVMPDHVHIVLTPLRDSQGSTFGMAEIMNGIKGASAHSVNNAIKRKGSVWQDESYDRILRRDESVEDVVTYVCENPIRRGLVAKVDDYPWLWRDWVEGMEESER
jgi:REP element-mobilizing transposase RayT